MGTFSQLEVQKALYGKLTGDGALMALVTGVYDRVTEDTAYPYVTLGEGTSADWSSKTTKGERVIATLGIFSRGGGRKEALTIMDRLHTLLHDGSMNITGHTLVLMRFSGSDIELERDGLTYQGTMRFQLLTEAA